MGKRKSLRLRSGAAKKTHGQKANRQIKSSMFSMLFNDPNSVIELVNALLGTNYGADTKAEITTLENVLSCGRLNDLSIVLDDILLVLIEHQSTINNNMPYRMLQYVCEIYKRRMKDDEEYKEYRIPLPRPVFIVLYNGVKETPDMELQRLSEAYSKTLPTFAGIGSLELEVIVININNERNKKLVKTCTLLHEYSIFIDTLRRNQETMPPIEATDKTVEECIAQGVLKDFLQKYKKELFSMLITDWNWDTALRVAKEENFEAGREEGIGIGREEGIEIGFERGIHEEKEKNALAMKKEGFDTKTISRITGLTEDEINRL